MKRLALILMVTAIFAAVPKIEAKTVNTVRFDGIYQAESGNSWNFLRFYSNGKVCETGTGKETHPNEVGTKKLKENYDQVNQSTFIRCGDYLVEGSQIKFTAGRVDYWGGIKTDSLLINWHSHINNRKGQNQAFWFVAGPTYAKRPELYKSQAAKSSPPKKSEKSQFSQPESLTGDFITEETEYDAYGFHHKQSLYNIEHRYVAQKLIERNRYNPYQINKVWILTNWGEHETVWEVNQPKNPVYLCLDGKGNVLLKDGKAIFVPAARVIQGSKFNKVGNKRINQIYGCQNCSEVFGIADCKFVW